MLNVNYLVAHEPNKVEYCSETYDETKLPEDRLLVKIDYSAISAGTELAWIAGNSNNTSVKSFPFYPGYSSSGHVIKVGSAVENFAAGDRVIVPWGGHRSYSTVIGNRVGFGVHKISDDRVDMLDASLTHIASFSMLGVRRLNIQMGEPVMIAGLGLLGLIKVFFIVKYFERENERWKKNKGAKEMNKINIAIDGPAGAGKSTIAKALAKQLNIVYVDTGAMYRAIGLYFSRKKVAKDDVETVERECENIDVSIGYENGEQIVYLNGENVNGLIRTPEAGMMASAFSMHKKVREKMVELQQNLAKKTSVVMDGRDIGTVVLPEAEVKIYLTASSAVRAKRRFDELVAKGMECDLTQLQKEIEERDYRDMTREVSPLKKAEDAVELDTSYLSIEEVVAAMQKIVAEKVGE